MRLHVANVRHTRAPRVSAERSGCDFLPIRVRRFVATGFVNGFTRLHAMAR